MFISGGSSGIGAELVRAFAARARGWRSAAPSPMAARALIDEVAAAGIRRPWYAACDVRDVVAYQALLARVIARWGRSACWSTTPAATTATRWKT